VGAASPMLPAGRCGVVCWPKRHSCKPGGTKNRRPQGQGSQPLPHCPEQRREACHKDERRVTRSEARRLKAMARLALIQLSCRWEEREACTNLKGPLYKGQEGVLERCSAEWQGAVTG